MTFQALTQAQLPAELAPLATTIQRLAIKGAEFNSQEEMQALIVAELQSEIQFLEKFGKAFDESEEVREAMYNETKAALLA